MKTSVLRFVVTLAGALLASAQLSARIVNLSTRGVLAANERQLVSGFVVAGPAAKQLLVRGVGPGLQDFGVTAAAARVKIELFDPAGARLAANDGFQTAPDIAALETTAAQVGAFPLRAAGDAAVLATVPPGAYTVVVSAGGDGAAVGNALIEVYDADPADALSSLVNISGRGMVGSGGNVLITGFVLAGDASHRLLIRGVGRDLATWGIASPAAVVGVNVYNPRGDLVATSASVATATVDQEMAAITGAFPLNASGGSATVVVLPPGAYTVAVGHADANADTDVGLLEVYDAGRVDRAVEVPVALAN